MHVYNDGCITGHDVLFSKVCYNYYSQPLERDISCCIDISNPGQQIDVITRKPPFMFRASITWDARGMEYSHQASMATITSSLEIYKSHKSFPELT